MMCYFPVLLSSPDFHGDHVALGYPVILSIVDFILRCYFLFGLTDHLWQVAEKSDVVVKWSLLETN